MGILYGLGVLLFQERDVVCVGQLHVCACALWEASKEPLADEAETSRPPLQFISLHALFLFACILFTCVSSFAVVFEQRCSRTCALRQSGRESWSIFSIAVVVPALMSHALRVRARLCYACVNGCGIHAHECVCILVIHVHEFFCICTVAAMRIKCQNDPHFYR